MRKIIALVGLTLSMQVNAALIAEYDLATTPNNSTNVAATFVEPGFTATDLILNNASSTTASFSNHFYHNGWDSTLNTSKYYETTIGNANNFSLSKVDFSMENTGGASTYWLRSSLDGFSADIASGSFLNGLVTNFSVNLAALGTLSAPVTFRWFVAGPSVSGFANHEIPGTGGGLADVGQDLGFYGQAVSVPEPGSLLLLGLGLAGLSFARKTRDTA
ncbi:PEP-CTERM sorting domain-containing protein [Marinobacter sp. VGCF2001]|uniref:PEP-CTERM sorting domain-containing protein n=1 Tax=Marinobacter sp. VGCF2001 TaxID=3417189 RepID=UPI003CF6017A